MAGSPTGKLLRNALRLEPSATASGDGAVAMVRAVWAEVLKLPDVAPAARFFDLGGSSAAALEILVLLSERVGHQLPIDVLLDGDTPVALAAAIARHTEMRA